MSQPPAPLEVRHGTDGRWQVHITENDGWHSCATEADARLIALAPVFEHEYLTRIRTGSKFADELEQLADAFERNGMRYGAGYFRDSAEILKR